MSSRSRSRRLTSDAATPDNVAMWIQTWVLNGAARLLGCVLGFGTVFEDDDDGDGLPPYDCVALPAHLPG
jgi:hypothetical protein